MAGKIKADNEGVSEDDKALLITVDDTGEADVVEFKLKASGIAVFRKYRETGAYLTLLLGKSSFGVDMFVHRDRLEDAKNILESARDIKDEDILSDPSFSDESLKKVNEEFLKKLDRRTWWMAGFFFTAVAILIYFIITR